MYSVWRMDATPARTLQSTVDAFAVPGAVDMDLRGIMNASAAIARVAAIFAPFIRFDMAMHLVGCMHASAAIASRIAIATLRFAERNMDVQLHFQYIYPEKNYGFRGIVLLVGIHFEY